MPQGPNNDPTHNTYQYDTVKNKVSVNKKTSTNPQFFLLVHLLMVPIQIQDTHMQFLLIPIKKKRNK